MILCPKCEIENRETASFCLNCGADLKQPEMPAFEEPSLDEMIVDPTPTLEMEGEAKEGAAIDEPVEPWAVLEPETEEGNVLPPLTKDDPDAEAAQEFPQTDPEPKVYLEEKSPEAELDALTSSDEQPVLEGDEPVSGDESVEPGQEPESVSEPILPPLEPGVILGERYEIVTLLEENLETLLYEALDYGRCTQCGYADSLSDDLYCANCGALIKSETEPAHVHLRALRLEGEAIIQLEEESEGRVECWLEADGQLYAVLPLPAVEPEEESAPFDRGVRHVVGYSSDVGLQRELDEDALLALTLAPVFESWSRPSLGLYAVADGMGGHQGGEVASRLAIEELSTIMTKRLLLPELGNEPVLPDTPHAMLREAVQASNARIYDMQQTTGSDMGTTLTTALVRDDLAIIANVGDSRTYLWRAGQLTQLTTDHSLVAQLVAAEMIEPDEIYTHPEKSAIYRSLGHMPDVEVDIFSQPLLPGDRLLLCCDGIWEMLRDDGIEEVLLSETDPQRACHEIVRRANLAGGEDNLSVVIVLFEALEGQ